MKFKIIFKRFIFTTYYTMDFVKHLVDNFNSIDINELDHNQLALYNHIDKYVNYTIPIKEGKITYNKENYAEYCNLFKNSIKNGTINPDLNINEIYNKIPYDKLDKWSKLNIIKKLRRIELTPNYKTPHVSKMDRQYIDSIITTSHQVIHEISKIYPLIELMKKNKLTVDKAVNILSNHLKE